MGNLTLADLRDELAITLGNRDDFSDAQLSRWINMGYSLVCQPEVRRHRETRTRYEFPLATDTSEYSLSKLTLGYNLLGLELVEFFDAAVILVSTRRVKLDPRPVEWFSNAQPVSTTGGPRFYCQDGDLLRVSPYPSAGDNGKLMRVTLLREPSPLVGDLDRTVLLDYFDNAVVMAGEYFAKIRIPGYRELAINARQELQTYCNQKLDAGETNTDPGSRMELVNENPMTGMR